MKASDSGILINYPEFQYGNYDFDAISARIENFSYLFDAASNGNIVVDPLNNNMTTIDAQAIFDQGYDPNRFESKVQDSIDFLSRSTFENIIVDLQILKRSSIFQKFQLRFNETLQEFRDGLEDTYTRVTIRENDFNKDAIDLVKNATDLKLTLAKQTADYDYSINSDDPCKKYMFEPVIVDSD